MRELREKHARASIHEVQGLAGPRRQRFLPNKSSVVLSTNVRVNKYNRPKFHSKVWRKLEQLIKLIEALK